jgi:branched-chain amino acid aminotransferase
MEITYSRDDLKNYISEGLQKMERDRLYVRLIITRGAGKIGLDPSLSDGQNLFIIFRNLPEQDPQYYTSGVKLVTTQVIRNSKNNIDPAVKSGNYLNNVLALQEAKKKGAYDAVMLNAQGNVTESSTSNIWIVENNRLLTPPLSAGLLGGITRGTLLEIGSGAVYPMIEEDFDLERLKRASEVFITSSSREVMPVVAIDEATIGDGKPGPAYHELHQLYKDYVQRKITDRH